MATAEERLAKIKEKQAQLKAEIMYGSAEIQ